MDRQLPAEPRTEASAGVDAPLVRTHPIGNLIKAWARDCRVRLGHSEVERRKARGILLDVVRDLNWSDAADIQGVAVLEWLTAYIEAGRSRKTAKNHLSRLRSFVDYLILRTVLKSNPLEKIKLPRGRRGKGARAFTADEVLRLIQVARHREATSGRARRFGPMASTFYEFLTHTEFRYSEGRRQLWEDVDLDRGAITLSGDKEERGDEIALSDEAVELLKAWREYSRGDRLFPHAPSHHTLEVDMKAARVPGLQKGKRGQWHRFRKCGVTERARAGANVRDLHKLSRHTDASLTLGAYDDLALAEQRNAANLLPSLRGGLTKRGARADDWGATMDPVQDPARMTATRPILPDCVPGRGGPTAPASQLKVSGHEAGRTIQQAWAKNGAGGNRPTGPSPRLAPPPLTAKGGQDGRLGESSDGAALLRRLWGVLPSEAWREGLLAAVRLGDGGGSEAQQGPDGDPALDGGAADPGARADQRTDQARGPGPAGSVPGLREAGQGGRAPRGLCEASGGRVALPFVPHEAAHPSAPVDRLTPEEGSTEAGRGTDALAAFNRAEKDSLLRLILRLVARGFIGSQIAAGLGDAVQAFMPDPPALVEQGRHP